MLNRVYWVVPGQIITCEVSAEVTLQDIRAIIEQTQAMIDHESQAAYVDLLFDISHVTGYSSDVMNIKTLFGAARKHERTRWMIIINPISNPVLNFVAQTMCQIFQTRLRIVPTREAALQFVQTEALP